MKVYGYTRVSNEEQVKSGSLNQQIDKIKERPEFKKMMETLSEDGAYEQDVEGIVVTKLDRFGRSVKDLVINMETLQEQEIDFISIGDSLDTSTPNGKLLFHILSAFAEFEREIIKGRMQAGRERARAQQPRARNYTDRKNSSIRTV